MKNNILKYVMSVLGFILLFINAISYLFNLDMGHPALTILGIVFVVFGKKLSNKNKIIKNE